MATEQYRKLTAAEMEKFGIKVASKNKVVEDYVKKYFPDTASMVHISFNSEYNDEGYRLNGIALLMVFDNHGNELLPKTNPLEARRVGCNLNIYPKEYDNYNDSCHNEPDDLVIYLNVPELYVKV